MMTYVYIAVAVVIACLLGAVTFLYGQTQSLQEALATERAKVVSLEAEKRTLELAVRDLEIKRVEDQAALQRINDEMIRINGENHELNARYTRLRGSLDNETLERPAVVERAARIDINRSLRDAECATRPDYCDDDAEPAADPAATPAGVPASDAAASGDDAGDSNAVD